MSHRLQSSVRLLSLVSSALLAVSCSSGTPGKTGAAGSGATGAAGTGTTGAAGTGSTGTAGTGSTGTAGTGSTGTAGTGAAGTGVTGAAGTGAAGRGAAGAGAAGTGAAGVTGAAGTGVTGAAGTGAADTGQSVLTRNKHETRDGFFTQPTLTKAMAAKMSPDTAFNTAAKFAGNSWAAPLYLENGPGGKGAFFVVTGPCANAQQCMDSNKVYALDETTGATVWMHSIGTPPLQGFAGCGNTTGITGTPVIDAASRTIYVAGVVNGAGGAQHEIHALSVDTGAEKAGWPLNAATQKGNGTLTFHSVAYNQRSALSLVNGILYVAYGGHVGDCNDYHGWVTAINTANPTMAGAWATGGQGEAIWAPGGMASNGDGVFAITGNANGGGATHADSEEVVHLTGLAQVNRTTGIYYPAHWRTMDQQDADFGSVSPVIINVGGTAYVAAGAKDGHFYLLNPTNLGGMGGHVVDYMLANGGAMAVKTTPAAYTSGTGVHVVMNANGGNCASGNGNIVSVLVSPGSPPTVRSAWCASGGDSSPIATSTNGKDETVVWYYNGGLKGVDGDTGASIYGGAGTCAGVRRWNSPIAVKGRIIVVGDGNLCSWSAK